MFAFRDQVGPVTFAVTDRHGGVSDGAWSSLNLGTSNGDDPDRVRANLQIVGEHVSVPAGRLVRMSQLHTNDVHVADDDTDMAVAVPYADALVTRTPGLALLVRVADCAPVVLADPERAVVGVVHAGRKGMVLDVATAAVEAMRGLGADEIHAWIGPRACGSCYEVPAQMRDEVAENVPQSWSTTSWGTPALDIGAGVTAQLTRAGVEVTDLAPAPAGCTIENDAYFSYRRQGQRSGRFGAIAMIEP